MTLRATAHFEKELNSLIDRFRLEYDATYAEIVGCLALAQHDLMVEAGEEDELE